MLTLRVQVLIKEQTKYGEYCDALYYTVSEFFGDNGKQLIPDEELEAKSQERANNWVTTLDEIKSQPPKPEPTQDEKFGTLVESLSEAERVKLKEWLIAESEKPEEIKVK